ncbi:unnamed protein product [Acanthoscelides obtectus]|uniref:Transposase n=1 Tax=Acanthoscelides obtectus TaxID=200917 RepID=A0A9P0M0U6_ACAOB|nr:unnamed protein product [Acanthoscelides obtectus]CAK1656288.1 hypothetical protein AOBTE_LOCUS19644 [Acanthoscelides obtectus]
MKGKTLSSQSQGLVLSLLNYFQQEKDNGGPLLPLLAVQERVAQALSISLSTITRIQRRLSSNDNVLRSPGKKRPRKKSKTTDLSDAVRHNIRDTVYQMYSESNDNEQKHVTIANLNKTLKEKELASISNSSLQRVLPTIGFKYKKDGNRRFLVEQSSIALLRTKFLRSYNDYVNTSSHQIVFMDETWIFSRKAIYCCPCRERKRIC